MVIPMADSVAFSEARVWPIEHMPHMREVIDAVRSSLPTTMASKNLWCFGDAPFAFFYNSLFDVYIDVSVAFNSGHVVTSTSNVCCSSFCLLPTEI